MTAHVELDRVSVTFTGRVGTVEAVREVSLSIAKGDLVGLVGPSGAGKSTLLRTINLLERPSAGRVLIDGREIGSLRGADLRRLRLGIGMVFQQFNLFAAKSVAANIGFPLRVAGVPAQRRSERIAELLDLVGLPDKAAARPRQLSGGQKQRVGIARALANQPSLLLCDEPTSALDPETADGILGLLRDLNRRLGITIVLVSHSLDAVRSTCRSIAVLDAGRVVQSGGIYEVFAEHRHPITRRLLREAHIGDDHPSPPGAMRLRAAGEGATKPLLSAATRELGVDLVLVAGGVDRIDGRPLADFTVVVTDTGRRAAVAAWMRERGVEVDEAHGS